MQRRIACGLVVVASLALVLQAGCAASKRDEVSWKKLFGVGPMTLPAPVRALRMGMTIDEAAAAGFDTSDLGAWIETPGARIGVAWTGSSKRRIESVLVRLRASSREVERVLMPMWGPPVVGTSAVKTRVVYWFADGLRVQMHDEPSALMEFVSALSVKQFLGDQPQRLGIETIPFVGATLDELGVAFPGHLAGEKLRGLPAIATASKTQVRLTVKDGKVSGFSVDSVCSDAAVVTALRDGLARRFGTGTDAPALRYDGTVISIDVGDIVSEASAQ